MPRVVIESPRADLVRDNSPTPFATTRGAVLEAAIDRLTRALASADDETIAELVAERRAMREELRALRDAETGGLRLADERAKRAR
jgi:hypothetical protein